ncbi:MAG: GlcNAc-PI de-N-acetylase [Chloroflexi bacterium]|nr:MAG: GlcNAc-PI de-N-acetylase [Chloroflexota bacterium]
MSRPVLLGVFAHPDDESFGPGGTLAKYAREGVDVHVCILTDGAAGEVDPAMLARSGCSSLAELRARELACACRVLGVSLHQLDYGDSGMDGKAGNGIRPNLASTPVEEVAQELARLILALRPQVILTHGPTGEYFHPDHIHVHRAVIKALENDEVAALPELRVYSSAIPAATMRWAILLLRLFGRDPTRFGENGDIDLTRVGTPDHEITVRLDVKPYYEIKRQASSCHASQGGGGGFGARWIPGFVLRALNRYEHFVQIAPPASEQYATLFPSPPKTGPVRSS